MESEERHVNTMKDEKDLDLQIKKEENISSKTFVNYVEPKLNITNNYRQLAEKTNLNLAPSNWLNEFLPGSFLPQVQKNTIGIDHSSLLMAGRYPEVLAEIDVVSASKHIKKLLKTPFNTNSSYSMSVHRIKNSLFINELDIPSFVKLNQFEKGDLSWLYELYCSANNVSNSEEIHPKKKNKELSQQQLMQSKFLYNSIATNQEDVQEPIQNENLTREFKRSNSICVAEANDQPTSSNSTIQQQLGSETNKAPQDFPSGSYFMHDVLWTFEDITMLVGSDLPIFGGGRYPAVSLRLHDASKPINILTGMDYWLDNLMCNVPELMMCYHLNGIVQKYEKIKTAELPSMEGSQFSPRIIKDVAQNILSFLKSNCTKEGHTYWLFKNNKEDVVKLYDLTSIAEQNNSRDSFGTSVGFLLYKIAFNMYISCQRTEHNVLKMVALLENCIKILRKERCKELLAMANFLLSDLYAQSLVLTTSTIDVNLSESNYKNDDSHTTDDESTDSNDSCEIHTSIDVKTLCDSVSIKRSYKKYEYINKNLDDEQKCKNAIQAVIEVLNLLYPLDDKSKKFEESSLELSIFNEKINENLLALPEKDGDKLIVKPFSMDGMKSQLLQIAVKSYLTLVRISLSKERFGRALRFLSIIFMALEKVQNKNLCAQALMYYGDTITMLASTNNLNIDLEKEHFMKTNKEDSELLKFITSNGDTTATEFCNVNVGKLEETFESNFEELLLKATEVYQQSSDNIVDENGTEFSQVTIDIMRRHANILNELGVLYMNKAASMASTFGVPLEAEIKLWKISYSYYEKGIKTFDSINDRPSIKFDEWLRLKQKYPRNRKPIFDGRLLHFFQPSKDSVSMSFQNYRSNMALLYSNSGKLMRLCAQVFGNSTKSCATEARGQFTQQEETYFNKAFEFYNKGLSLLSGNINQPIKDSLLMELAGAHLSLATLMQDNAPLQSMAEEKVVKQISSSLMKSLHYVESISSTEHNKECQKQMGIVHQKLGFLYRHVLRNQISDTGKKNYRSLAELHYSKVYNHYHPRDQPIKLIQVILEHLALHNHLLAQNQSQKSLKSKHKLLFDDKIPLFDAVKEIAKREIEGQLDFANKTEVTKLLTWLFGQLNQTLKESIKYLNGKTNRNLNGLDIKQVKKMFEVVLRGTLPETLQGKLVGMCDILKQLHSLYKEAL